MPKTFFGGVTPLHKKITKDDKITELKPPAKLYIPLSQRIGDFLPKVAVGDNVKMGTLLGIKKSGLPVSIFSPVSGKVMAIQDHITTNGKYVPHIVIDNDYSDTPEYFEPLSNPSPQEIIKRIGDCGIIGMGGAGFPTAIKLFPGKDDKIDTLILNGSECEPYLTSDYRVMLEYPEEILRGSLYIAKALNVDNIIVGIEDNKPKAIAKMREVIAAYPEFSNITVKELITKYPEGAEKMLIYSVTGRVVPSGCLPKAAGTAVQNVHTALTVYYAITKGEPLFKRVITVSGDAIDKKGNYWVRTGALYSDLIDLCGLKVTDEDIKDKEKKIKELKEKIQQKAYDGEKTKKDYKLELKTAKKELLQLKKYECVKIINGGPMMGEAVNNVDVAITSTNTVFLFLTKDETHANKPVSCINCGRCALSCPMKLMPMFIDSSYKAGNIEDAKKYGVMECNLCGCCGYVCPAKRALVTSMILAKKAVRERGI